ncbi:MAG: sugar ABC transporter permease [Euzebyaceae bacterium]|nr:sugar ABC transporter permease [Euzebyaceae bacterium]
MATAIEPARTTAAVPPAARWSGARRHLTGWAFAAPWVIIFAIFLAGPILASLAMSFTDFGLKDLRNPIGTNFIGVGNYTTLASDPKFLAAAGNTAYFVLAGVPLTLGVGLLAALGLNVAVVRFKALFRVGYYLPVVTSIVAIAVIWRYLLHPDLGLINVLLSGVGIDGPNWLANPALAMPAIILMAVWRNVGFVMVIFLAGLQGVPNDLYEAGRIDGTRKWSEFRWITLPMLRPTLLFAAVITSIGYLQLFEEPFVMTAGGPLDRTLSIAMYVYEQGFNFLHFGYAAAISYALFVAIVVLTIVQFRFLRPQT